MGVVDAGRRSVTNGCPPPRDVLGVVAAVRDAATQQLCLDVDVDVVVAPAAAIVAAGVATDLDEGDDGKQSSRAETPG